MSRLSRATEAALASFWTFLASRDVTILCLLHTPRSGANLYSERLFRCGYGTIGSGFELFCLDTLPGLPAAETLTTTIRQLRQAVESEARGGVLVFKMSVAAFARLGGGLAQCDPGLAGFDIRLLIPRLRFAHVTRDPLEAGLSIAAAARSGRWDPLRSPADVQNMDELEPHTVLEHFRTTLNVVYYINKIAATVHGIETVDYSAIVSPGLSALRAAERATGVRLMEPGRWAEQIPVYERSGALTTACAQVSAAFESMGIAPGAGLNAMPPRRKNPSAPAWRG